MRAYRERTRTSPAGEGRRVLSAGWRTLDVQKDRCCSDRPPPSLQFWMNLVSHCHGCYIVGPISAPFGLELHPLELRIVSRFLTNHVQIWRKASKLKNANTQSLFISAICSAGREKVLGLLDKKWAGWRTSGRAINSNYVWQWGTAKFYSALFLTVDPAGV